MLPMLNTISKEVFMSRDNIAWEGKNFILVLERKGRNSSKGKIGVIRSSGYTTTVKALNEPWLLTQLKVLPFSNRSHLSDPFILPQTTKDLMAPYENTDSSVYNLFFTPECKGIRAAANEFLWFYEKIFCPNYENTALVGYSKGGLLMAGMASYLQETTNILLIAPTLGTPMGEELAIRNLLKSYQNRQKSKKPFIKGEVAFLKLITHMIFSRRPVDKDMAMGSKFVEQLELQALARHNSMLIMALCPEGDCSIGEKFFRYYGNCLQLSKFGDGMVGLERQMLAAPYVKRKETISATHPNVLKKAGVYIEDFLRDIKNNK